MKLLFLHIVKTGGTTANNVIATICRRRGYFVHVMDGEKANDFGREQLELIADAPGFDQYCHSHIGAFDRDLHDKFRARGWFTICFTRNPLDLLCSLYHSTPEAQGQTLDAYLASTIKDPDTMWRIPEWHADINYLRVFSTGRLVSFLKIHMSETEPKVGHRNASGSRGFAHHLATGEIKTATVKKLMASPQTKLFAELAKAEKL
jgi:hypothetical protein